MVYRLKMVKQTEKKTMRIKIKQKKSGTYSIESISIKELRAINKMENNRKWWISKNGMNLYLSAEN